MRHAPILPLVVERLRYAVNGKVLLHDLSFVLEAGRRTVLLGPNGAGKTLTLRLCHGLLLPTSGSLRWSGDAAARPGRQAMVFQRPVMLRRSVAANIRVALALAGIPREVRGEHTRWALERTGLSDLAHRAARQLSGGEQQRLALARAWATRPEVLFLDEPTANLDPAATRAIEELIQAIHESGTKIVMTTHDLGQARRLADEIFFLCRGHLLEQGPADAFFDTPRSAEAQAFLKGELLW